MENSVQTKECFRCKEIKSSNEFHKNACTPTGLRSMCIACNEVYRRSEECLRKRREYAKSRNHLNPAFSMLERARHRARRDNVPCSLTIKDIKIPEVCPVLGIALKVGTREEKDYSPSLDKVVPSLGYIPSNVRVISHRANRIKADATLEELQKVVKYIKANTPAKTSNK